MASLSRLLKAFADWLDSRFPEKITTAQVNRQMVELREDIENIKKKLFREIMDHSSPLAMRISAAEDDIKKLNDEMNKAKTFLAIKSRVASSSESFRPYLAPVRPAPISQEDKRLNEALNNFQ